MGKACIDHLFGYSPWDLAVGWGGVVASGHPIFRTVPAAPSSPLGAL